MSYFAPHLDKYLLKGELLVPISSDGMTEDNYGNIVPQIKMQSIVCYLKEASTPTQQTMGGVDTNRTYFKGYLVNPSQYPASLSPPLECDAYINNKKGRFFIDPHTSQPWEKTVGEQISGWFVRQ